ncbi:MAG: TetR/AcrR family transcriptional regulator [Rubrobacter sp.]|nr:TetR/AcrR family transcriptional regulator [Rubrobacter sp.]
MAEKNPTGRTAGRRAPRQERGRRRVAKILDAAEKVFAEAGYEAATNTEIAERAETSIGSVYQFFPNKEAILEALVDRYLEELRALHDTELSVEAARLPLPVLLDRAVGALAEFKAERPAFWPIFYGSDTSEELSAAAQELLGEVVGRLDAIFAVRVPELEEDKRGLYARIAVEVFRALLPVALEGDTGHRAWVVAETKALLLAYLGPILGTEAIPASGESSRGTSES